MLYVSPGNIGTAPDIEIDITPQDYRKGRHLQMEKALEVIQDILANEPPVKPDFSKRPNLHIQPLPHKQGAGSFSY